jgi:hypothetical protein
MGILLMAAAMRPPKFKNLKVLPKDISERAMDSIMSSYCKALNVSCDFCHKPPVNFTGLQPVNTEPDFSLDNPTKEIARTMIRLTTDINKNYFNFNDAPEPAYLNTVSCNTCHRGKPYPGKE